MTKLEQLKAAYEAAHIEEAQWLAEESADFYILAHNTMPLLIEAAELVQECYDGGEMRGAEHRVKALLEKLK